MRGIRRLVSVVVSGVVASQVVGCTFVAPHHRKIGVPADLLVVGGAVLYASGQICHEKYVERCEGKQIGSLMIGGGLAAVGLLVGAVAIGFEVATAMEPEPPPSPAPEPLAVAPGPRPPLPEGRVDAVTRQLAAQARGAAARGHCDAVDLLVRRVRQRDPAYAAELVDSGAVACDPAPQPERQPWPLPGVPLDPGPSLADSPTAGSR